MSPLKSNEDTPISSWLRRLSLDVRPGEGELCMVFFLLHFLLLTFQYTAKSIRQSIYIDALGAEQLPYVYLLVAICSFPLLQLYGRYVERLSQRQLLVGSSLLVGASMLLFRWLFATGMRWVSVVFYLWIAIVGLLLVSQFWWFVSHRLNPRQAKRLFGAIGAGGLLGGVAGGQLARLASQFGSHDALWGAAAVLGLQAVVVAWACRGSAPAPLKPSVETETAETATAEATGKAKDEKGDVPDELNGDVAAAATAPKVEDVGAAKSGFSLVRRSRYLQLISLVLLMSAMVAQVIDLQFSWAIERSTQTLAERTAAFGNLYSIMGLSAFVFQLFFTARILRRLGVGFSMRVLPVSNGLGTVVFMLAALTAPALLLPAVWLLKICENGLRYSLDQSTRELLFLPVPAKDRAHAKSFIDVFVQRLAKGLAALALLTVTFGWIEVEHTVLFSFVWIAVWLLLLGPTQRHYLSAFRQGLRHRLGSPDSTLALDDVATLERLVEGLNSHEPREVLHSLDLLNQHGRGHLVTPFLLHHDDVGVRIRTLEILKQQGRKGDGVHIEHLLLDDDGGVRVAAVRALAACSSGDVDQVMIERLSDPVPGIRGAAIGYLLGQSPEHGEAADRALLEMLGDGDPNVRIAAARALGNLSDPIHQASLVRLLYDGEPKVVHQAIQSVRERACCGECSPLYTPILISLLRHRQLKHEARDALVAFGSSVVPALEHFMADDQESIWVRRALPKTLARIGGTDALDTLSRSLDVPDPFLRRKIIEALATLVQQEDAKPPKDLVHRQLMRECHDHLVALFDVTSLRQGNEVAELGDDPPTRRWGRGELLGRSGGPHLLERLLADRMRDHMRNLFNLLALIYPPKDIRAAYDGLASEQPGLRAHALEYLDNLLTGDLRQQIFTVIDDLPGSERQRQASRLFGVTPRSTSLALEKLVQRRDPGDADAVWLSAAALHYIHEEGLESLYWLVRRADSMDSSPLVQETTSYLLSHIDASS